MSVLIKGMQKPKDCYHCRLHYGHGECGVSVDGECPLIELPDHGRLVDVDEMERMFLEATGTSISFNGVPTVIPAERNGEENV